MIDTTTSLIQHFEQYIKVSSTLKNELVSRLVFTSFKKGAMVHNASTICTKSYFITKGILRNYYIKDDKEISEYFSSSEEWVNSPRSFMMRQLDIYYIDAIEDTEVFCLYVADLGYLFDNFPEMEHYARLSMGSVFGHFMDRVNGMQFTTAKEKYIHFCNSYPGIYHRIPLGMVASYLGITQETLSRIRREK